ncbi:hypothetical protein F511_39509 [Dorcoceras hygrometricum]|uniref:Uncharacterized protein n=1 Tax=Dorcoceras hygrometricum TaxID=472368 RepID=A0A2Z7CTK6_9LAMI|nr:hypothetical protein F511_39509 [Dorcoceras hygrometricum]
MASSLISNIHHIDFDSVFDMDDAGLAQVFETLIATGLRNFLDCPVIFYEEALLEFFANVEDLTDLTDVPKDKIFDARSLFSASKEQASFDAVAHDRFLLMMAITSDVKENLGSLLFGVLTAMLTPGSRKAKGFSIQIVVLLQNMQGLVLGVSKGFPKSRILDAKTVHRFVHINEKVGLDESAASPRVKKTPLKKAVTMKKQVGAGEEAPVMKKKRTTKGKPVVIAQEFVPLQTVEATTDAPVEQLSVPKRKSQKRKRKLVLEDATVVQKSVDEMVERVDAPVPASVEQPAVVPVVEGTTENPDTVINQVLNQLDSISCDKDDKQSDRAETWFDRAFDEMLRNDSPVVTPSDIDEEEETIDVGAAGGDQQHQLEWTRPSSSSLFEGPVIDRGFFIPPNHHSITSKCWIRVKIMVDGSWLILEGVYYWRPINTPVNSKRWEAQPQRPYLDDLAPLCVFVEPVQDIDSRPSLSRAISIVWAEICMEAVQFSLLGSLRPVGSRMDNAHSDILSRLHTIERGLQNTLGHQSDYFRNIIQSARQEGQNQDDLQILRLNELRKTVMAQGVAAIRSEQLEFQSKMAADLLSLSTQIVDLVDYIRGGDAKRGGSSSRRPLPTPVNQGESSGNVIRTTEIISQTDIDAAQRDIMERMMRADKERDGERREIRLSRIGSYKRRREY